MNDVDASNEVLSGQRVLTLENWNVGDAAQEADAFLSVINLVARTWDSFDEINAADLGNSTQLGQFRAASGWNQGQEVPSGSTESGDGNWYYRTGAEFVDDRGSINPFEDWASVWELSMNPNASQADLNRLATKIGRLDAFFGSIS